MYLIPAEEYTNAGVHVLKTRKTGKIWVIMINVHDGLGVKNMFDLILKEINGRYEIKTLRKSKLENTKWMKKKFMKYMLT